MIDAYIPTPPDPDDGPTVTTFMDKITAAIARGVIGFFRQSSDEQRVRNTGSQRAQEEQLQQLQPFGVKQDQIRVILAYGESAREGVVRKKFQELKEAIRSGEVGLLLLARHDRLSRNTPDASEVFALLVEYEVLIMVDGRMYDPSNEGDALILGLHAQFAEYENRVRSRWMAVTRLAKARNLELRIKLPAGLTWADPENEEYRKRAQEAGLSDWLREPLGEACSEFEGRKYYPLPYPDPEVVTALRLLRTWVLETRNLVEVEKRIRSGHDGWPRPGQFPVPLRSRPYPKVEVGWTPVTMNGIYMYLKSASLYGRYRYDAAALRGRKKKNRPVELESAPTVKPKLEQRRADVDVPQAFRSWYAPEEERIVRRIISGRGRTPFERKPGHPTQSHCHAIAALRCGKEVAPGKRCGRRLMPYLNRGKYLYYQASGCRQTRAPHFWDVSGEVDHQVLQILVDMFQQDALSKTAEELRVKRSSSQEQLRTLGRDLARAERDRDSAEKLALDAKATQLEAEHDHEEAPTGDGWAKIEDSRDAVKRWTAKAAEARRQIRDIRRRIGEQEQRAADYQTVTDEELRKCTAVAADLPDLIERVRNVPGALQKIVEALTSEVWLRKLATGIYELTVEFASGESVVRIFTANARPCTQPMRLLAASRLAAGVEPADVAAELARYPNPQGRSVAPFNAENAEGAALMHRYFETEVPREGEHLTIDEVATTVGECCDAVIAQVLAGKLGPARWSDDDRLLIRPTEPEMHRAFPSFALLEVARANHLDPKSLVPVSTISGANRSMSERELRAVLRRHHVYQDAISRRYYFRRDMEREGLSTEVSESQLEEARTALANAVAALGRADLRPENFHPRADVVRRLGVRFQIVTHHQLTSRARRGIIPTVRCLGIADSGRIYDDLVHVHVPPHVLTTESEREVEDWLNGDGASASPLPNGRGRASSRRPGRGHRRIRETPATR